MIPTKKEPDKMNLLVGILRLAKAEGIDPPPLGVKAFRGNGRCKVYLDRIEVYSEAAIEDYLTAAVSWVHQAADRRRSEAIIARRALVATRGDLPMERLELDDDHAARPGYNQSDAWVKGAYSADYFAKIEMDDFVC